MARLVRVEYEGAIHHVTVRGDNRRDLFVDDRDRERLMKRLAVCAEDCGVRIYAFCLMVNHVHLVLETPHANLGAFMQRVQTGYTIYYNLRHSECGHVTQGRYGAKVVEGDAYLLALARYVHLNPVFVGAMIKQPIEERIQALRKYRWSSYRAYLGRKEWPFVNQRPLLAMMHGRSEGRRRAAFRSFVESGLAENDEDFLSVYKASRLGIGGEEFLETVEARYETAARKHKRPEDVSLRRVGIWLPKGDIVAATCRTLGVEVGEERCRRREGWVRAVAARMLMRHGGLTQREVAVELGVGTGRAVGAQLDRLRQGLGDNHALARKVRALETEFEQIKKDAAKC